jgi:bifunctional non-homologous end joining protein LigD
MKNGNEKSKESQMSSSAAQPQGEKISLFYKDGSSDKAYHAQLEPKGSGFVVNFQYGRRFQSLQAGTKTQSPVAYAVAKKIFDKLVAEKKGKGYTEGEEGTPYQGTEQAGEVSGVVPQLLNFIEEDEIETYIKDPDFMMQEKMDGVRCLIRVKGNKVEGINRKGLVVSLPKPIEDAVLLLERNCILDGERIGDTFYAFDLLQLDNKDFRLEGAIARYEELHELMGACEPALVLVQNVLTESGKRMLLQLLKNKKAEGFVLKHRHAKYVAGRPNSGGNQLKYKFYATGTFRVARVNNKRSVMLEVKCPTGYMDIGNVTIPVNWEIPQVGDLVEVRYLYAFPNGSLFQPTYLGKRDDKNGADEHSSLQFKQTNEEDEA